MMTRTSRPETTTISIRIERQTLDRLRELARRLSMEWHRDLGYPDLIRDAVNRMYPKEDHLAQRQTSGAAGSLDRGLQQAEKRETGHALEEETKVGR